LRVQTSIAGVPHNYSGSAIATDGTLKCDGTDCPLWEDSKGRRARLEIGGFTSRRGNGNEEFDITIDDFDGHTAVLVKAWYPRTEYNEEFWLIGSDGCTAIAEQMKKRDSNG